MIFPRPRPAAQGAGVGWGAVIRSGGRAQLALDGLIALVFAVVTVPLSAVALLGIEQPWPAAIAAAVPMTAAAACCRRAPALALGLAWAGAVLQLACRQPPLPVDLAVFGVLFQSAAAGRPRLRTAGLVSALLGAAVAAAYLVVPGWVSQPRVGVLEALLLFLAGAVSFVLAWTFGLLSWIVREARVARQTALREQQEAAAEQERGRIARDMHDVVAHSLAVIIAQADGARYLGRDQSEALGTIAGVARDALGDVRVLLERLRYRQGDLPQPDDDDIVQLAVQIRDAGLPVELAVAPAPPRVPTGVRLALYRIAQESLTNALRHADRARPARLDLSWGERGARLRVRSALDPARPPAASPGHGLLGMRERARLAGGTFDAAAVGGEFVVTAELPLSRGQDS